MKITPLDKVVREHSVDVIRFSDGRKPVFTSLREYEAIQDHIIKGDYELSKGRVSNNVELMILGSLDKELNIEIGEFKIEGAQPVQGIKSEEDDNKIYSVVIQHKHSENMSGKDIRLSDVIPFTKACITSFKKNHPLDPVKDSDFLIILVDWENKNIRTQQILD